MARKRADDHPVTAYARAVVSGGIPAGKLVRLACERHLNDLVTANERGLRFDEGIANRAIGFFGFCKQSKGEWAGQPIQLQPWQQFVIGSTFGWLRKDGTRRFRTVYEEIPRKNGKSTKAAGVGNYCFIADGESGAEVYSAATKKDQAKIVWSEASRMVKGSPSLRKRVDVLKSNMSIPGTASKFEPLGADDDTLDGLNISAAIVDEVHAHKTRGVVDVIETATGSRRQPLVYYITTAGSDRTSVCFELHDYAEKILTGVVHDDTFFAYIATVDEGDDWTDPATWTKANPNLGISVKLDDLQRKCEKAKAMPSAQNAFKRLHLNIWTEQVNRWITAEDWKGCALGAIDELSLAGRPCYTGVDLSTTSDTTSTCHVFAPAESDGPWLAVWRFWVPRQSLKKKDRREAGLLQTWADQGFITLTDGDVVDYDVVRASLNADGDKFAIAELAYDPWNATQLATQMQGDGFTVVPFRQGYASLSEPTKLVERLVLSKKLNHGGNPVVAWMVNNVAIKSDPAGNVKPDKSKSAGRIDGVISLIEGLGRASIQPPPTESVYETRGVRAF